MLEQAELRGTPMMGPNGPPNRLMQKERLKSSQKSLLYQANLNRGGFCFRFIYCFIILVILGITTSHLAILASHFRTRAGLPEKFHLGSCLHQRDLDRTIPIKLYTQLRPFKRTPSS